MHKNILKFTLLLRLKFKSKIRYLIKKIFDKFSLHNNSYLKIGFKTNFENIIINKNFDKASEHFYNKRWAYLENPIEGKIYNKIIDSWPSTIYFNPYPSSTKIQDVGFKWGSFMSKKQINENLKYINSFSGLSNFYGYLISNEFCERVRKFLRVNEKMCCYFISSRVSKTGGKLAFHMDGAGKIKELKNKAINIVWHINGIDGSKNGGICLSSSQDIEYNWPKGLIHESTRLRNSCLIYDMTDEVGNYHGYPPMNEGTFRWVITSQFWPESCLSINKN
tara:strand:- start:242 stop:1075 length:834 start_codon:yes stop_codon:yes gene_type:complete